jgi:signal recognition particle subunit SRP54
LRIAQGSGTSTQEVNALLKQFKMVSQMMKSMTKGGKGKRMALPPGMEGLGDLGGLGQFPTG